jgi:hypothetical protein
MTQHDYERSTGLIRDGSSGDLAPQSEDSELIIDMDGHNLNDSDDGLLPRGLPKHPHPTTYSPIATKMKKGGPSGLELRDM